jgi:TPR repeat protein
MSTASESGIDGDSERERERKFELASTHEKEGAFYEAIALWREVADDANSSKSHRIRANMNLGRVYTIGKTEAVGFAYFKAAATLGDVEAIANVGSMLMMAQGVEQNDKESFEWFKLGAAQGHAFSLFCVASALKNGRGVQRNEKEAVKFYERAAKAGSRDAAMDLSIMLKHGDGVPPNQAAAERYLLRGLQLRRTFFKDGVKRPAGSMFQRVEDVMTAQRPLQSCLDVDAIRRAMNKKCSTCDSGTDLKSCAGCGQVWYCNAECQKKDWKKHKEMCKKSKNN